MLLKSILESIPVTDGKSSMCLKVDIVKLYIEPEEIQALNSNKKFATNCDMVCKRNRSACHGKKVRDIWDFRA